MVYIYNDTDFRFTDTVVTIGKFDGLHLGHQALFEQMKLVSERDELKSVVLSLDNVRVIRGDDLSGNTEIYSEEQRRELLTKRGPQVFISFPFTREVMEMSPEEFVREIIVKKLGAKAVVVGDDFRFGCGRSGNTDTLAQLGTKYGFSVIVCNEVSFGGARVSSTLIRNLIAGGDSELAAEMLNAGWFDEKK